MGQEAIKARMDPRIVDAMRAVRALEDEDELDEDGLEVLEADGEQDGEPGAKRRRIDVDDNSLPPPDVPSQPMGLLTADTLEGLKYFAEIRKRNGAVQSKAANPPRTAGFGGLGLADYGSDDDD